MKKKIAKIHEQACNAEAKLMVAMEDLDNQMNECKCNCQVKYVFTNTIGDTEVNIFCLNCGGYIDPNGE